MVFSKMIGVALLIGVFLPIEGKAEGIGAQLRIQNLVAVPVLAGRINYVDFQRITQPKGYGYPRKLQFSDKLVGIKPAQNFCSSQLSLKTEEGMLSANGLWISEESNQDSNKVLERSKASMGTYAVEFFGASVGGLMGGPVVSITLRSRLPKGSGGAEEAAQIFGGMIILGVSYGITLPVSSALGVSIVGKLTDQNGSFWKALVGSYIGVALSLPIVYYGIRPKVENGEAHCPGNPTLLRVGIASSLLLPTIGAVIGYNKK